MINTMNIKNDLKQIGRDPIMLLLLLAPILMVGSFKFILLFLVPFLQGYFKFDLEPYNAYILYLTLILTPGMLGIITGFMMLDEKDSNIVELMAVTPLGLSGYLINRLSFSAVATVIYTLLAYYFLDIYTIPFGTLICLTIVLGWFSAIIGLILYSIAGDKVKGLTYAKGLNTIFLIGLTDLLDVKWLTVMSMAFPTYWVAQVILEPELMYNYVAMISTHGIWFMIILNKYLHKKNI